MRITLGYQVLIAVLLGMFCGIFFGPLCTAIQPVGDIYVMLLQMVVLPYICFSIIHGLGSITPIMGKKLFRAGWPFWLILWAFIFFLIYLVSLLIPKPLHSFIGTASLSPPESDLAKNFILYLVPQNLVYDLANNIVPAVTVFGLIVGTALMHLEKKEPILSLLAKTNQTIEKIFHWLAIVSPIGVFAHISVAAGTVKFEDLYALEFYILCFIGITLLFTFWILPALLSSLTPIKYGEVMKAFKFVCLLPFATALPTIALPFITVYMKKLRTQHEGEDPHFPATSQTVMPLCYSFGQIGNCLILFFVFFLSFFYRHPFEGLEKVLLSILVVPLSFGSSVTTINAASFLIRELHFPKEAIQLFAQTMAITLNFQVLLSIASVLTLIILVLHSYYGILELKWKRLCGHLLPAIAICILAVAGLKGKIPLRDKYNDLYPSLSIHQVLNHPVSAKIIGANEVRSEGAGDTLERILKSGVLRVGFDPVTIPYCYYNNKNELAGYDVAYAYQLAKDLNCDLEFVPLNINTLGQDLDNRKFDIAMCSILMNDSRLENMVFTAPYTEQDNVLIVPAKNKLQYTDLAKVQEMTDLRIGATGAYVAVAKRYFPLAQVYPGVPLGSDPNGTEIDAYVWSRSSAIVWCLPQPEYAVIDYGSKIGRMYIAYPIPPGEFNWSSFLNNWLLIQEQAGFKKKMESYWIEGQWAQELTQNQKRWSVIRNVLHWVD